MVDTVTRPRQRRVKFNRSEAIRLHRNLSTPIPQFRSDATLETMRKVTGKVSEESVRRAARVLRPNKG